MIPGISDFDYKDRLTAEEAANPQSVIDVGFRYTASLENFDVDRYISCFTDDPQFLIRDPKDTEFRNYASPKVAGVPGASLAVGVAQVQFTLARIDSIHWVRSNFQVSIADDRARMISNYICTHRLDSHSTGPFCILYGTYIEDLVLTDRWRIALHRNHIRSIQGDLAIVRGGADRYPEDVQTKTEIVR
ncbi:MAG: hypothetical protein P0Y64_12610 [Candidatus Sphingomonas colombiensis]|nr:hypothetical protein [Sphingomonas sp.]WEK42234.1 MAG: hypothetical protein P0Y64_12610 [Sphingomonas sp.]